MKGEMANCKRCGVEFIKKSRVHVFCQYECSQKYFQNIQEKKLISNQFAVFERDEFRCIYCGKSSIEENARLVLDHIIPLSKGGGNEHSNLVTACTACNSAKLNKMLSPEILERIATKITK